MSPALRISLCLAFFVSFAHAQSSSKYEFGIGYSLARMAVPGSAHPVNNHALALDVTRNVNRWLGFTGEFDMYYHCVTGCQPYSDISRNNSFIVLAGPRLKLARGKLVPWIHALGGYADMRFSSDFGAFDSWSGGAGAIGGGLDIPYGRFAVRVAQLDYLRTPSPGLPDSFRVTAGVVINLGKPVK